MVLKTVMQLVETVLDFVVVVGLICLVFVDNDIILEIIEKETTTYGFHIRFKNGEKLKIPRIFGMTTDSNPSRPLILYKDKKINFCLSLKRFLTICRV